MLPRSVWSLSGSLATTLGSRWLQPIAPVLENNPIIVQHLCRWYSGLPPFTELRMPALSPTMSHGNLASWTVKEGDSVSAGDPLAEIETDKATLTWETQDDGVVGKLLMPAGSKDVEVGTVVALLVDEADDIPKLAAYKAPSTGVSSALSASMGNALDASATHDDAANTDDTWHDRLGPAVRVLLETFHLDAEKVHHSGPHGILTKADVLAAASGDASPSTPPRSSRAKPMAAVGGSPASSSETSTTTTTSGAATVSTPSPSSIGDDATPPFVDIPVSQIRRIIASRLCESKQTIPHLYLTAEVALEQIARMRASLKMMGFRVSVNDFVVQAVAQALAEVPAANAYWDVQNEEIKPFAGVDVCVAVATPSGLLTPIVKNANTLSLLNISSTVRDLATRARVNKLAPEEFTGGSFTISNLGMYGIDKFFAIINPPQAAIMAVGGAHDKVELNSNGVLTTSSLMTVTLSADHRVYDGNTGSAFLDAFRKHMQQPGSHVL